MENAITMAGFTFATLPVWITGVAGSNRWHMGRQWVRVGHVTGRVHGTGQVAACNGRQIGGAWGYRRTAETPLQPDLCARLAGLD